MGGRNERNWDVRGVRIGFRQHANPRGCRQPSRWISGVPGAGRRFCGEPTVPAGRWYRSGPHRPSALPVGYLQRYPSCSFGKPYPGPREKGPRGDVARRGRSRAFCRAARPAACGARNGYPEVSARPAGTRAVAARRQPGSARAGAGVVLERDTSIPAGTARAHRQVRSGPGAASISGFADRTGRRRS